MKAIIAKAVCAVTEKDMPCLSPKSPSVSSECELPVLAYRSIIFYPQYCIIFSEPLSIFQAELFFRDSNSDTRNIRFFGAGFPISAGDAPL